MSEWDPHFLEGQIVSHVCVKGLNNNVNSFCTEVEKYLFLTVWRTSAIIIQTPHSAATQLLWCSELYITSVLWDLRICPCNQNTIFAIGLCMAEVVCHYVIFLLFSNTAFPTFSQTGCQQRTKYKQRGCFQMKVFNVHALFFSTRPKEKYEAHQYYNIFPFKQKKNTNTNRTTL